MLFVAEIDAEYFPSQPFPKVCKEAFEDNELALLEKRYPRELNLTTNCPLSI